MTFRTRQLPFVASYAPASDLNTVGPVVLIGGLIAVSILSRGSSGSRWPDLESAAVFWGVLAAAVLPPAFLGRNTELDLPTAFDVPRARDDPAGSGVKASGRGRRSPGYFQASIAFRTGASGGSSLTSSRLPSGSVMETVNEPLPIVRGVPTCKPRSRSRAATAATSST